MPSDIQIALAETKEEKRAVYRFRYRIYVEEMGKYRSVANHALRLFSEPCDAHSRIFYATENGEVDHLRPVAPLDTRTPSQLFHLAHGIHPMTQLPARFG